MRIVLFGYGYMGRIRYQVLKRQPEVERICVVDPLSRSLPADASVAGLPEVPPGALESAEEVPWDAVDAAFVCTPNHVTAALCVETLRRGKHLFCEKPPGRNWEEFSSIAEAADRSPGRVVAFGFNHRLHPSIQAMRSFVGQGGLGEILYVKGTYGKSGGLRYRQSWRNRIEISGGGILLDQGIHMLDLFCFFLGPLSVVDAVLRDSFWGCGVEDNAFVLLRSREGVPAFLHSSATLWKHTFRLEIGCRDGYLVAQGLLSQTGSYGREQLTIGWRQFEDEAMALGNPREEIIHFDRDASWDQEVQDFLCAIREGRPVASGTVEDARQVMKIIHEAYALDSQLTPERRG